MDPLGLVQVTLDYEGRARVVGGDLAGPAAELPISSVGLKTRYAGAFDDVVTNRRYIWATFEVTNKTASTLNNLTMYAYSKDGNSAAGTALTGIRNFGGGLITSEQVARSIQPVHGMKRAGLSPKVNPEEADFQAFSTSEAQALETAARGKGYLGANDEVLEYGFVARNLTGGRAIASGGTGVVTLTFKMPKPLATADIPYQFNVYLAMADQPTVRVTRGLDDTTADAKARATAITGTTGTKEVVLIGSDSETAGTGYTTKRLENVLLSRNTDPTPVTYLIDPLAGFTCPTGPAGAPVYRIRPSTTITPKTLVTFTADDGWLQDYTVLRTIFKDRGVVAGTAIVSDVIGTGGYMSWTQVLALQSDGWEIMGHTRTHVDLLTLTPAQVDDQLRVSQEVIAAKIGRPVRNFVYPYGSHNTMIRATSCKYYRSAFHAWGGGLSVGTSLPSFNILRAALGAYLEPYEDSLAHYKSLVDQAIAQKAWLVFMLHSVPTEFTATRQQHLKDTIDYIKSKGVQIVTPNQALDLLNHP